MVQEFEGNDKVVFGDVTVAEAPLLRGPPHNPGAGGWPTIRYYNAETGLDGASYVQKTSDRICVELGPGTKYMNEYVLDVIGKDDGGMGEEL